jgi:hypothetical protein
MGRYRGGQASNMVRGHGVTFDKYVDGLTTMRPGMIGRQDDRARTEMYIDPSPYFSLAGLNLHHNTEPEQRSRAASKNPRAHTDFETLSRPARNRSCGKPSGKAPLHQTAGSYQGERRGAPPIRGGWGETNGK